MTGDEINEVPAEVLEATCEAMHDAYERAAGANGWATQESSRKPWADVPESNKATMRAALTAAAPLLRAPLVAEIERLRVENDTMRKAVATDAVIEAAAIALYEQQRGEEYRDSYYDWPNIDGAYDWDGDDADLPEGELRPAGEWLRDRFREDARVVLLAAREAQEVGR